MGTKSLRGYINRAKALRFEVIRSKVLQGANGVLHVGAHYGQEAERYDRLNLPVMWVEADPEKHSVLLERLAPFPLQQSKLGLVGRENREAVDFFVANNDGGSSSIYPFLEGGTEEHKIGMTGSTKLPMVRLDTLFSDNEIEGLSHWVLDVQGAELEALVGAGSYLAQCHTLEIEVSLREVYEGGVRFAELEKWLNSEGFVSLWDPPPNSHWEHLYFRIRSA